MKCLLSEPSPNGWAEISQSAAGGGRLRDEHMQKPETRPVHVRSYKWFSVVWHKESSVHVWGRRGSVSRDEAGEVSRMTSQRALVNYRLEQHGIGTGKSSSKKFVLFGLGRSSIMVFYWSLGHKRKIILSLFKMLVFHLWIFCINISFLNIIYHDGCFLGAP